MKDIRFQVLFCCLSYLGSFEEFNIVTHSTTVYTVSILSTYTQLVFFLLENNINLIDFESVIQEQFESCVNLM